MAAVQDSDPGRRHRPVTQDDVAQKVGVSRALVSLAFRGAPGVSEESRRTILETGRLLGYRHNTIAADLAAKTRNTIGLYLLDFRNEVYADVFRGVRDALERKGNRVILAVSDADEPTDQNAVGTLIEARVGVIIAATLREGCKESTVSMPTTRPARRRRRAICSISGTGVSRTSPAWSTKAIYCAVVPMKQP